MRWNRHFSAFYKINGGKKALFQAVLWTSHFFYKALLSLLRKSDTRLAVFFLFRILLHSVQRQARLAVETVLNSLPQSMQTFTLYLTGFGRFWLDIFSMHASQILFL